MPMTLAPLLVLGLLWWGVGASRVISPDGTFYLRAARGEGIPRPYGLRWLLPALCGEDLTKWTVLRTVLTLGLAAQCWHWAYLHLVDPALFTAAVLALPLIRTAWVFPVLVDLGGLNAMLAIGLVGGSGPWWAQVALGLLGGLIHERAPIMGALLAWSPLPLVGSLVTAFLWWRTPATFPYVLPGWLRAPVAEARKEGRLDLQLLLLPWGLGALALLAPWASRDLVFVAAAYLPLLAAQDHARVYQWAFPVVLVKALTVVPAEWALAALVLHLLNPWRKTI